MEIRDTFLLINKNMSSHPKEDSLKNLLSKVLHDSVEEFEPHPPLFDMSLKSDVSQLRIFLVKQGKNIVKIDHYLRMLQEFFDVTHPQLKHNPLEKEKLFNKFLAKHTTNHDLERCGVWVYYPWTNKIVHCLDKDRYQRVRTSRNQNLVSLEEQKVLYRLHIGVIGLSVGQAAVLNLVIGGIGNFMRLADPDIIECTNLNRILGSLENLYTKKAYFLAKKIYEINPFAELDLYPTLITQNNIDDFLCKGKRLDVVIDAFDDIKMKINLRVVAKKYRIPVVMATDLGNGAMVDVERFDMNKETPLFGGRISDIDIDSLPETLEYKDIARFASQIIGMENLPLRMKESLSQVGKTLAGHPQLALASSLAGTLTTFAVKQIALNKKISKNRVHIPFEKLFEEEDRSA